MSDGFLFVVAPYVAMASLLAGTLAGLSGRWKGTRSAPSSLDGVREFAGRARLFAIGPFSGRDQSLLPRTKPANDGIR